MASLTRGRMGFLLTNITKVLTKTTSNFYKTQQNLFHCSSFLLGKGQEIKMPSLSPTMAEGKIVKWLKKEGDMVSPGDVLCEIETDKAIVSMEVDDEGILAKILVPESSSVIKVGSAIAVMVSEGEDWKNVDIPTELKMKTDCPESASASSSSAEPERSVVSGPPTFPVKMPSLSPTMTAGTIVRWAKAEGDTVCPGDLLCDIQTDKAVMSLEAEEEGILAKILVPDDSQNVKVGTLIALLVPEGEDWKSVVVPTSESSTEKKGVSQAVPVSSPGSGDARGKSFGPAVKAMLATYQLEPGLIKPTGRNNRLLKEDVMKYIDDNKLEKKPPKAISLPSVQSKTDKTKPKSVPQKVPTAVASKYSDISLSNQQQVTAKKIVQSKQQIPHSYSVTKCDIARLMEAKDTFSAEEIKISVDDLLTKATALALQIYPKANAVCINNQVRLAKDVNICVVLPTDKGLCSLLVKSANLKSVTSISQEIKHVTDGEKSVILSPEEMEGGSFTISNLGVFGVTEFKPIISSPQCGVLAVGGVIESFTPELVLQKHVTLSLSYDRRALQEDEAIEFMETLKYVIENPKIILLDMHRNSAGMSI